ncbi:MAG: hypothetical protein N2652_05415 [Kiritimatiellae bacterium]|nr:hypothetical protein [Kiritimatiellia bacterium]
MSWPLCALALAAGAGASTSTALTAAATGSVASASVSAPAPVSSGDVERSRTEFDRRLQELDARASQIAMVWGAAYLSMLRDLRWVLQSAGRLRDMVAVHDEILRFERERTLPAPEAARSPGEWAALVAQVSAQMKNELYAVEVEIVETAARHLQVIAQARAGAESEVLSAYDTERDRVVSHPRVRAALAASATPPPPLPADANPLPATVGTADKRRLRLAGPADEDADRAMGYALDITVTEDRSRMHQSRTQGAPKLGQSHTVAGPVLYRFQVTLTTRNAELPADCRLVVEYFKRGLVDGVRSFHASEEIKLPAMRRQESRTFDLKGIELVMSETRTVTQIGSTRNFSGHDFHGLIASIVDPSGRVIFQRYSPQSLGRETVPVPGRRP